MANQSLYHDDSDMKIALPKASKAPFSEEEVHETLAQMEKIRQKGLLLQACQVGAAMAATVAGMPAGEDPVIRDQKIWLCVFGVTVGCESCVHDAAMARTVLNAFHDHFRTLCPDAYEHTGYSVALSFYYLAVRSVGDSVNEIARTFAMLCGDESNASLQAMGRETYENCLQHMEHLTAPLNQQEDERHGE